MGTNYDVPTPLVTPKPTYAQQITDALNALDRIHINVKAPKFGAVGDGVTNDAAAIQAAIDAAATSGGVVYFPPGVYKINSTIVGEFNVVLEGHRSGRDPTWTNVTLLWGGGAAPMLDFRNKDHYEVRGIRLDGNNAATYGIRQGYTSGTQHVAFAFVRDVTFQQINGTAVDSGSSLAAGAPNDCLYENVIIEDSCVIGYDFYSTNNVIRGGAIAGCTQAGVKVHLSCSLTVEGGTVFSGNDTDVLLEADDFINTLNFFGVWFERSVQGIIRRPTVPSGAKWVGSINLVGCQMDTANATRLFDFTNIQGAVNILGGRIAAGSASNVAVIPSTVQVLRVGTEGTITKSGAGVLAAIADFVDFPQGVAGLKREQLGATAVRETAVDGTGIHIHQKLRGGDPGNVNMANETACMFVDEGAGRIVIRYRKSDGTGQIINLPYAPG